MLPDAVLDELRAVDAILLGAVGTPDVPPGVLERGLLLKLRFTFDLYVNLRPVKLLPGVVSPIAGSDSLSAATSSSSGRTPRASTRVRAACSRGAPRRRSRPRSR